MMARSVFIDREAGEIIRAFGAKQYQGQERISSDSQEYIDFIAPPKLPSTPAERVDAAFPQTDMAKAIFNAFFIHENRIRALEGQPAITKAQLKKWFESQLD